MLKRLTLSTNHFPAVALIALAIGSISIAACGGSSSGPDSSASATTASSANGTKSFERKYAEKRSTQIVEFGSEAPVAEREAASAVLSENLKARAADEFAAQCDSLGVAGLKALLGEVKDEQTARANCPKELRKAAEPFKATEGARANNLSGSIEALRVEDGKAYALYHASNGTGFAMPMEMENGEWRVGALLTIALE